jgi:hypothetical protein
MCVVAMWLVWCRPHEQGLHQAVRRPSATLFPGHGNPFRDLQVRGYDQTTDHTRPDHIAPCIPACILTHLVAPTSHFVLFCSVLFCSVLFCSVLFCSVLFCSVLFCSVLFCSVLFCSDLLLLVTSVTGVNASSTSPTTLPR